MPLTGFLRHKVRALKVAQPEVAPDRNVFRGSSETQHPETSVKMASRGYHPLIGRLLAHSKDIPGTMRTKSERNIHRLRRAHCTISFQRFHIRSSTYSLPPLHSSVSPPWIRQTLIKTLSPIKRLPDRLRTIGFRTCTPAEV